MHYTIYKITNKINGKFYIGKHKTKNLDDGYMGSGKLIRAAIKKHGVENFEKELLHVFQTEAEMNEAEKRLVILSEDSYNLCPGGYGGWGYLNDGTQEHLSRSKKGRASANESILQKYGVDNPSKIEAVRAIKSKKLKERWLFGNMPPPPSWRGKRHNLETKRIIGEKNSITQAGTKNSQYGTRWITDGVANKKIKKEECIPNGWILGRTLAQEQVFRLVS